VTPRILVVDDEPRMADVVAMALTRGGYECEICASATLALEALEQRGADVVVTDWKMPQMDGLDLLRHLQARQPALPVILMTAFATVANAVAAMREGAFDYITKPFDNDDLRATVARALEVTRLQRENKYLRQEVGSRYAPDQPVAESPQSQALLDLIRRVAPSRATVLVQGESGTGKELVARQLHYWSERVGKPFVAINCKAFSEGVLESELFGHEKGAFTGAIAARAGCFERAHEGTLFLDEIGEVSVEFQAKLLRVLQDGEVLRVGGSQPRTFQARIVAATNRTLRDEIAAGRFREDLFFRLNVIPVQLTPLRERRQDILPLARHFLHRFATESGRPLSLSTASEAALVGHAWRGNVRELENVIERASVLARSDSIEPEDLLLDSFGAIVEPVPTGGNPSGCHGHRGGGADPAGVAVSARTAVRSGTRTRHRADHALSIDEAPWDRVRRFVALPGAGCGWFRTSH